MDGKYLKMLEDKWDEMGICDNYEVLKNEQTRFAIHFDDNEYASIEGVSDEKGEWETEPWSCLDVSVSGELAHGTREFEPDEKRRRQPGVESARFGEPLGRYGVGFGKASEQGAQAETP